MGVTPPRLSRRLAGPALLVGAAALLGACQLGPTSDQAADDRSPAQEPSGATQFGEEGTHVVLAAGDIAKCGEEGAQQTADLLDGLPGTVVPLGDLAYEDGTPEEFADCYAPTWGRQKERTLPVPGNHDFHTPGGAGYFGYFGEVAGEPGKGWYSTDLGAWHVVVLNSECDAVGGCHAGSEQEQWLRRDLAASRARCTLAAWHHPRFSSGVHGSHESVEPLWQALYDAGAEIVLSGHDHTYERFAPLTPDGAADPAGGVVQFVVGTGGNELYDWGTPVAHSVARDNETYGVLELALAEDGASWRFVPVAGASFTDSSSLSCH